MRSIIWTCLLTCLMFSNTALALPIDYSASGKLSLEILSFSTNLTVSAESTIFNPAITNGQSFATQTFDILGNPLALSAGDLLSAYSSVTGSSPPDSDAYALGAGRLTITNNSNDIASLSIRAFWSLTVNTPIDADLFDLAAVQVSPFLLNAGGNDLLNSGSGIFLASSTAFGGGLFTENASNIFNLTINPNSSFTLDIGTLSLGQSNATPVPEPSTFISLLIAGTITLVFTKFKHQDVKFLQHS